MKPVCMFCQFPKKLSKEHVWPVWLKQHLPVQHGVKRVDRHQWLEVPGQPVRYVPRAGDYSTMKLKVVCTDCNNQWMSRLQVSAKPLVSELVKGREVDVSHSMLALANWCTTFAMVLELGNRLSVVTKPQVRQRFMREQRPPQSWFVLAGVTDERPGINRQAWSRKARIEHSAPIEVTEHLSFTTIISGRFVFQVQGCEFWTDQRHRQLMAYARSEGFLVLHPSENPDGPVPVTKVATRDARAYTLGLCDAFMNASDELHGPVTVTRWPYL